MLGVKNINRIFDGVTNHGGVVILSKAELTVNQIVSRRESLEPPRVFLRFLATMRL